MGHVSEMVGTMSTKVVTVQEAEGHLLELIALVEQGEEFVITHDDRPKAKLVPIVEPPQKRAFGQYRGQVWMSPDFDDPLPDDFWLSGNP
jgi:antitoxin (DNA-binding transcriptional repressor) of toxin-antitoxin stability system